jgi:arylamine N-acetyltransferase
LIDIPDLSQYLEGIEKYHLGGTCYSNNYFLNQLLNFLGYDVKLCGAEMKRANSHMVNLITIDKKEYLVDVGYAAPFIEPIPRYLPTDFKISLGSDEYRLQPKDSNGCSRMILFRNGIEHHGYKVNPIPQKIGEFTNVIKESFKPEATFMNSLLLVRFDTNYSQVIHNKEYIETKGGELIRKKFNTRKELLTAIENIFSIPLFISQSAIDKLPLNTNAWS